MSHYTLAPELLTFKPNEHGGESQIGIVVRRTWEGLNSVARDLMIHCWCSKKDNDIIRSAILAHLDTTEAQELITHDLCGDLQYLHTEFAMTYISDSPIFFKTTHVS